MGRPSMRFVPNKNTSQQDVQALHSRSAHQVAHGAGQRDPCIRYFLAAAKGKRVRHFLPCCPRSSLHRCHFQVSWCWASWAWVTDERRWRPRPFELKIPPNCKLYRAIVQPIICPKLGLARPPCANHISGRATRNNRLRPRGRPCRGHVALLYRLTCENWLLPTNVGPLLRYRTTHEQDKKYQHQADRCRKGEDVKVGQ